MDLVVGLAMGNGLNSGVSWLFLLVFYLVVYRREIAVFPVYFGYKSLGNF